MFHLIFSLLLLISLSDDAHWKTILNQANQLKAEGKFLEAGMAFEEAWLLDETNSELLVLAGDAYMQARKFSMASRVYEEALLDGSSAHFIQYKLGLALKQSGSYQSAIEQLSESLQTEAVGSYILASIIEKEIAGCEMAMSSEFRLESVKISHMGNDINSAGSDYAPLSAAGNTLYYASTKSGKSALYQSILLNGSWTTPEASRDFERIISGLYSGGSFNKDRTAFYFSVCDETPTSTVVGKNCIINRSLKSPNGWGYPEPMRDYINWEGASSTHPSIVYEGDTEVIYFSSDRPGGKGGMDIWYATREANSDDLDFTFPVNAGPTINTAQDDVTPFYDRTSGVLYFSSNGHPNAGGLDVFQSPGKRDQWSRPVNLGSPVNSPADDYFYHAKVGTNKAFITSNRILDNGMKTTEDDDIFELDFSETDEQSLVATSNLPAKSSSIVSSTGTGSEDPNLFHIKGRITDSSSGKVLKETYVTLYRAIGETQRKKIETIKTETGAYNFSMRPGEYYIVEAYKPGYQIGDFEFNSEELDSGISLDIPLEGYSPRSTPLVDASESTSSIPIAIETSESTSSSTTKPTTESYTGYSSDEIVEGTEYRIQLTAVGKYNPMLPIFSKARKYGSLGTEMHPNMRLTRVFLTTFNSYNEAKSLVPTMREFGFDTAFVVKYVNGRRVTL